MSTGPDDENVGDEIGRAGSTDYSVLRDQLSEQELDYLLAKYNNTGKARQVIARARDVLGGNGILLENHVIRHQADIEAIYTYEGTASI